jgi:hypothetical protein
MNATPPGKWQQLGENFNYGWASVAVAGKTDVIAVGGFSSWRWYPHNNWFKDADLPMWYEQNRVSTLTELPDGSLLAIGVNRKSSIEDASPRTTVAARYRLGSATWTRINGPNLQREAHGAVVQASGSWRVMIAGGIDISNGDGADPPGMTSCEWYIPEWDRWMPAPSLLEPRYAPAMVALSDGIRLMAFGGSDRGNFWLTSAEMFTGDEWIAVPSIPMDTAYPSAVTLSDGRVVVTGDSEYVLVFDPEKLAWEEPVRLLGDPQSQLAGWLPIGQLKDGTVLVNRSQVYDPVARECRLVAPMPTRMESDEGYCTTPEGGLLMLGGIEEDQVAMRFDID